MIKNDVEKHILVLDDVQLMCHFLFESLSVLPNVECHTATRISTAENVLDNYDVSLAIIDLHLAEDNGFHVVQKIRQDAFNTDHDIPILIFSGNATKDAVKKCLAFDVNDFLAKPITSVEVRSRVERHFVQKKSIKPTDFYLKLGVPEPTSPDSHSPSRRGGITENNSGSYTYSPKNHTAESKAKSGGNGTSGFLSWPDNATTGIHQLDRRLKDLCFDINELYHQVIKRNKASESQEVIRKIRMAIDDIRFVSKSLKKNNKSEDFWVFLEEHLAILSQNRFELFYKNQAKNFQPESLFKKIRSAWMSLLNKPLISNMNPGQKDESA